jgi:signal transduction histidine kinase
MLRIPCLKWLLVSRLFSIASVIVFPLFYLHRDSVSVASKYRLVVNRLLRTPLRRALYVYCLQGHIVARTWSSRLRKWAIHLGVPVDVRIASPQVRQIVDAERLDLVRRRITFAIWFGVLAYPTNVVESWFGFRDAGVVAIQASAELLLVSLGLLTLTSWGKAHKFALFHAGYALVLVAYEVTVCYKNAFGTIWGDGFLEYFMFYCLLIPTSVPLTAGIGLGSMLLMSVPESVLISLASGAISFLGNVTAFLILVASRSVANTAWENERLAHHAEMAARQIQTETVKRQLDFISAVSHELRNPLMVLCLTSEQLLSGRVTEQDARIEQYRMLRRESERLNKRVEGLLTFGRTLSPADFERKRDLIDPAELVDSVIREFKNSASAIDYELVTSVADDTPLIEGDVTALSTAVWNLLDNAVKYSPDCKNIWIEVGREGDNAYLRVRDQGRGVAEDDFGRIFDKYVRGKSAANTNGTGIGLSIVRYVVEAHRGEIRLESRIGKGSSFTLVMPGVPLKAPREGT